MSQFGLSVRLDAVNESNTSFGALLNAIKACDGQRRRAFVNYFSERDDVLRSITTVTLHDKQFRGTMENDKTHFTANLIEGMAAIIAKTGTPTEETIEALEILQSAMLPEHVKKQAKESIIAQSPTQPQLQCPLCLDDLGESNVFDTENGIVFGKSCWHPACRKCLGSWFNQKGGKDGKPKVPVACPVCKSEGQYTAPYLEMFENSRALARNTWAERTAFAAKTAERVDQKKRKHEEEASACIATERPRGVKPLMDDSRQEWMKYILESIDDGCYKLLKAESPRDGAPYVFLVKGTLKTFPIKPALKDIMKMKFSWSLGFATEGDGKFSEWGLPQDEWENLKQQALQPQNSQAANPSSNPYAQMSSHTETAPASYAPCHEAAEEFEEEEVDVPSGNAFAAFGLPE